jgi:hypothetical protein
MLPPAFAAAAALVKARILTPFEICFLYVPKAGFKIIRTNTFRAQTVNCPLSVNTLSASEQPEIVRAPADNLRDEEEP